MVNTGETCLGLETRGSKMDLSSGDGQEVAFQSAFLFDFIEWLAPDGFRHLRCGWELLAPVGHYGKMA